MEHATSSKESTATGAAPQQIKNNLKPFQKHRMPVRKTRSSSQPCQVAKFATSRTLTQKLDELAAGLKPEEKKEEAVLREKWDEAERLCEQSRFKKGEALCGYKELYKAEKKWKSFLQAIGIKRRTADDYVARYRAASEIPAAYREAAERERVDLGKPAVQNLVPIEEWKKKNHPTAEQAEEAIRQLKDQSKRPAPATTRSGDNAKDRQDKLLQYAIKLYEPIDPAIRAKEIPQIVKRLMSHFAISEAA
jgi:hypothetical protein